MASPESPPPVGVVLEKFRSGEDTPYETVTVDEHGEMTVIRRDEEV